MSAARMPRSRAPILRWIEWPSLARIAIGVAVGVAIGALALAAIGALS